MKKPVREFPLALLFVLVALSAVFLSLLTSPLVAQPAAEPEVPRSETSTGSDLDALFKILEGPRSEGLMHLQDAWHPGYAPMVLEITTLARDPALARQLIDLLGEKTGQVHGYDLDAWYRWIWNQEAQLHPDYAAFKARLYQRIDPRFARYFDQARDPEKVKIRLDEIRWGGVVQDGIPPLRDPKMILAESASYLDDGDVIFGLEIDGDLRAYPKRILAWHEMFTDTVGGVRVAGAYCTLCGSMIVWETHLGENLRGENLRGEKIHELGTSGFLYRSNKLMYDRATQSLWSTLRGKPVVGPLTEANLQLKMRPVTTTTWGAWRKRHPQTRVLSLDTGFDRDYGEGVAYRDYFATDELMFGVPKIDARLKNKDEVLAVVLPEYRDKPVALASAFLKKNPLHREQIGKVAFVVLTDKSGAHRVYRTGEIQLKKWDRKGQAIDTEGGRWSLQEDALIAADGRRLERIPAHRAFWFGWSAAWPQTRLVL